MDSKRSIRQSLLAFVSDEGLAGIGYRQEGYLVTGAQRRNEV